MSTLVEQLKSEFTHTLANLNSSSAELFAISFSNKIIETDEHESHTIANRFSEALILIQSIQGLSNNLQITGVNKDTAEERAKFTHKARVRRFLDV
jgi:hypothetical protein